MQLQDIARIIESVAPRELQESYDNAGLQCGDPHQEVSRVLTCLDVTEQTVAEAQRRQCQLIVAHHPLLFHGVKCVDPTRSYINRTLIAAIRAGIGIYAAHTNLDRAEGGMNYTLAALLGLTAVQPLSDCGVWGQLPSAMTSRQLLQHVSHVLGGIALRYNVEAAQSLSTLRSLALCTGAGGEMQAEAEALGVDAFLTGEIRYHEYFGHPSQLLIEAGHFETEQIATTLLADIIQRQAPDVECLPAECHQSPCGLFLP